MKKLILVLLIIFSLCACKKDDTIINDNDDIDIEETIEVNNDLELYSDNNKIVFRSDDGFLVYYYKNNKITGNEAYIYYHDNETAKYALSQIEKNENMKNIYVKNNYIVIVYNEKEYNGLTVEDVKNTYSYLEEEIK